MKNTANYNNFETLDIRVGKIINIEDSQTKKPTYKITIDFGSEIGVKKSCGAYRNYNKEFLLGRQIVGIVNFEAKKMGPEISEVLILGVLNEKNETIFLTPESEVPLGVVVF